MNTLFIFGYGFSASYFAQHYLQQGWTVLATAREPLEVPGVEMIRFDENHPITDIAERLKNVTHILHSIPPHKETGDCVFNLHAQDLEKLPNLQWMGYLSTTGVYGNADGNMVDETSPRHPTSARARARKQAEDNWLASHLPIHIFRLAGIYGPGRSIFESISKGRAKAIDKPGHAFSRIHVEDIAGVLHASVAHPHPGTVYNVCDDEPLEPLTVLKTACDIMGADLPPVQSFDDAAQEMSSMALTFWNDNKRVDNNKIKDELGYQLRYPDHTSGLNAIWKERQKNG